MDHIIHSKKSIELSAETKQIYELGSRMVAQTHPKTQEFLANFIEGKIRAGVCCDFDNTLVPTDEINRIFYSLLDDPSGTKGPLCGLTMLDDIPVGIISGNSVEYVTSRCAEPMQDFMLESPSKASINNIAVYALNGGYILSYDKTGAEDSDYMNKYNISKRMPANIAKKITGIMMEEVSHRIAEIVASGYDPLEIRAGETTVHTFAPMFQDRAGVQKCVVGVSKNIREELVAAVRARAKATGIDESLDIQPGGQYSIDCQMTDLKKRHAGSDFMAKFNLSHLIYLGDAVYVKSDGSEGNDYSMVHNKNTYVFAVNEDHHKVPEKDDGKVQWIGNGPAASRAFLTWLLISRANHLQQSNKQTSDHLWAIFSYLGLCS